jgi:uncharacterized protein (TIGR02145 family)
MKTNIVFTILLAIAGVSILAIKIMKENPEVVPLIETGTFTDTRDGKVYKTIKIGNQWMMAENFAYTPVQGNFWAYEDDSSNVVLYGYLYDWETSKSISPEGWHLPSASEWKVLRKSLGGKRDIYQKLGGTMEKVYQNMAINGCGFNALMAGVRAGNGQYRFIGEQTHFWSSTPSRDGQHFYILDAKIDKKPHGYFDSEEGIATLAKHQDHANWGKSVRLFRD